MSEVTTSNIGFEKQIWDAACVLRGNIDASEYKSVVLGLIFLKYISDRFEAKYKELVEEGDGFEEDQRQRRHRALRHLRNVDAVHHVVKCLHQHGYDHGQRHVGDQLPDGHDAHFVFL